MSDLTYTVKAEGVKDVEALTRSLESLHKVLDSGKGSGKALEEVRRLIVGFKGQASVFEEMRNSMQSMQQTMTDMSNKMPAVVRMMTQGITREMRVMSAAMRVDGANAGKDFADSLAAQLAAGKGKVKAAAQALQQAAATAPTVAVAKAAAPTVNLPNLKDKPDDVLKLASAFDKLVLSGNDVHSMARGLASGFNLLWLTWGNLVPLFIGAGISNGFMQTAKTGMEVAHTMKTIAVLGGNTAQEMAALSAELDRLGKSGPFGPKEIAESMKTLSLAGLKANEILAVTKDVLNFSVAGTTDLKTAADALVSISTAFGMGAQGFGRVADVVSKAAAESKSSVESFANAMKTASVINKQYGVSLEDTATGIAALSQLGIEGTAAGTALRNMYADLSGRSMQVAKVLKAQGIEMRTATGEFRPMLEVVAELNNKLLKLDGISQKNLLQAILSERGAKGMVELLQLIQQEAKDMGSGLGSALAELQRNITESYGFAAISAAQLAQTTQESFKAVKATLSTSMNEAYQAMEPTLYLLADTLKKTFSSPEFVSGLTTMVTFVVELARKFVGLTKFVVEHAEAIALVSAAYVGVTMLIRNKAAAMAASTAATTADTAATVANNAAKAGAVGALGTMARFLPGIGTAITVAAGMWALYDMWQNRAKDTTKEAADVYNTNVVNTLKDQADKLERLNALRATGISLSEAQARLDAEGKVQDSTLGARGGLKSALAEVSDAENELAKVRNNFFLTEGLRASALEKAQNRVSEATKKAVQAQVKVNNAAADSEAQLLRIREESRKKAEWMDAEAKARQKKLAKGFGTGAFSLVDAKGANGVMPSARLESYTEQKALTEITKARDEELANTKRSYDLQKQLLDNKNKNELISRAEYAIQVAAQTDAFEEHQLKSLTDYNQKYQDQSLKAIKELQRNEELYREAGNKDRADNFASLAETQREAAIRVAKDTVEKIANIQQEAATRNRIIIQDMAGEASKLLKADDKIWKDRRDKLNAAKDLEAINLQYKYLNTSVFSAAEGEKAYVMAMAETMSSVRAQNKALEELADHLQAVADAQYAIIMTKDYTGQEDGMSEADLARLQKLLTAKEAVAKLRQRIASNTEQGFIQGAEEGALAMAKVMQEKRDALVNGLSSAIETAVFEGGSAGGKAMRQYLQDELLRKPFRAFVQTTVSYVLNGVLGSVGGAAVSSIAGGAANSVLGSVGTSLATSAGLSVTGMTGLGTALGEGFMSTVSGLFTGGAPVTSMGMGASGAAFNVGAALPYAGAALVVANALGLFRKTTTTDVGIKGTLGYQSDLSAFTTKRKSGTLFSGPSYWDELASLGDKQNEAIDNSVKSVYTAVEASAKALGLNADAIRDFTQEIFVSTKDLTEEQVQAKLSAEFTKLGDSLSALVLPTAEYAKVGEAASQTLQRLAASLTAVNNTFNLLGLKLFDVSAAGADAASKLVDAFGGLESFNSKFSAYYDAFYTEEEKRANVVKEITKTLQAAGSELTENDIASKTVQEFRAIYESLVKTKGAADPLAVAMINVAGAFASVTDKAKLTAEQIRANTLQADRKDRLAAQREREKQEAEALQKQVEAYAEGAEQFNTLRDSLLKAGDAAGLLAAVTKRAFADPSGKYMSGKYELPRWESTDTAASFNYRYGEMQARMRQQLGNEASANALRIENVAGVLQAYSVEQMMSEYDPVTGPLKIAIQQAIVDASGDVGYAVRDAVSGAALYVAQQQVRSQFQSTGPGLASVAAASAAAADASRTSLDAATGLYRIGGMSVEYGKALDNLKGAMNSGAITADIFERSVVALNEAMPGAAESIGTLEDAIAAAQSASYELGTAGLSSIRHYFGSLSELAAEFAAAAVQAQEPIAQATAAIGRLNSAQYAFAGSAAAALQGFGGAGAAGIDMLSHSGVSQDIRRAQLIAEAAGIASAAMTTADAAAAAVKLAKNPAFAELDKQGIRDAALLLDGVGEYNADGFERAFIRISDALAKGNVTESQYKALFDVALDMFEGVPEETRKLIDSMTRLRDAMSSFADGLLIDKQRTTLTAGATLAETQRQYAQAYTSAATGDTEAINKYESLANTLLDRELYATEAEYNAVFGRIYRDARVLEGFGGAEAAKAEGAEIVDELKNMNANLSRRVAGLEENLMAALAQIAKNTDATNKGVRQQTAIIEETP